MKMLIALSAFFVICTGIEAKKMKKCLDTDGRVYRIGQGYETNCTQFTCQEIGPKLEMVASLSSYCCWDNGQQYQIGQIVSTQKIEKVKKCESVEGKATVTDETMFGKYCIYEEEIIPVGNKLALTDICVFVTCEFISINETKIPSLKLEMNVKPPGSGCCLGEDGDNMLKEGVNRTLESGLEATCHAGSWETIHKNFNLVLTGGYDGWNSLSSSELLSSDGLCNQNIPPLPVTLYGARSVYIKDYLMVCGGCGSGGYGSTCSDSNYQDSYQDSCYTLNSSSSSWTKAAPLNNKRQRFSLTKAGQELYVLGGYNGNDLDSIEKFSGDEWELLSQTMTSPRHAHCTVYLESNHSLVVTGGYPAKNKVEMLDLKTLTWSTLDSLPVPHLKYHQCQVLKGDREETIYVTGGYSGRGQSKVWKMSRGTWSLAGDLKQAREGHSMGIMVASPVVMGGLNPRGYMLHSVERMDSQGNWESLPTSLSVARGFHAMAAVPAEAFPCIK